MEIVYIFYLQGTRRVSVSSITVGSGIDLHAGSLLHEQIRVKVSAVIKGKQKEYDWIAKIHRSEHESSNYARFQVDYMMNIQILITVFHLKIFMCSTILKQNFLFRELWRQK